MEATLLKVGEQTPTKKLKVRGSYRFTPLLWVPINGAVTRHGNLTNALHNNLQVAYKKLEKRDSIYDDLS